MYTLDDYENIWEIYFYQSGEEMFAYSTCRPTDLLSVGMKLVSENSDSYSYTSMVVGEDQALFYLSTMD